MYPKDYTQQHLFIINNYNSHMIANFIVFCMEYLINLFILFPHISYLFQLFDIIVFALLKHALIKKTDIIF